MTDVIEWGGGEVWKLVEGGDVICNGKQVMVLRSRLFTWGTQWGGGGGRMKMHVAPSMQSSLVSICSLVPTCMTAFVSLIKISWYRKQSSTGIL